MKISIPAKYQKYVAIGLGSVVLLIGVWIWRSRPIWDNSSVIHGKYLQAKAEYNTLKKAADKQIELLKKDIAEKDKDIAERDKKIAANTASLVATNVKLAGLEKDYALLTDCPSQKENLLQQVSTWKDKFSLAQDTITQQGGQIFSLTAQYNDQVKISEELQRKLTSCENVSVKCDNDVRGLQKDIKRMRFWTNVKTGVVVVAAGYIAYSFLKGK